jgi:hypothetical protein
VHARIYEVPISYSGRSYWEGKKIRWTDGIVALWTILRYAFVDDQENADPGYKTLLRLSRAERYNQWMFQQLSPWLGARSSRSGRHQELHPLPRGARAGAGHRPQSPISHILANVRPPRRSVAPLDLSVRSALAARMIPSCA